MWFTLKRSPERTTGTLGHMPMAACLGLMLTLFTASGSGATPPGTVIENTAEILATTQSGATTMFWSNTDRLEVDEAILLEPARLETYRIAPTGAPSGSIPSARFRSPQGTWEPIPIPAPGSPTGEDTTNANVLVAQTFRSGEYVLLEIRDTARNQIPDRPEAVSLRLTNPESGEKEVLELSETGPNTGRFAAFIRLEHSPGSKRLCYQHIGVGCVFPGTG